MVITSKQHVSFSHGAFDLDVNALMAHLISSGKKSANLKDMILNYTHFAAF